MAGMENHVGPLIGDAEPRVYSYQSEFVQPLLILRAQPAAYTNCDEGKRVNADLASFREYELSFSRHTANSLVVTLRKKLSSNAFVQSRKANGEGTAAVCYTTTMSFADVANRLLGPGCQCFEDREAFPDAIKAAMKEAYDL